MKPNTDSSWEASSRCSVSQWHVVIQPCDAASRWRRTDKFSMTPTSFPAATRVDSRARLAQPSACCLGYGLPIRSVPASGD